MCRVELDFENKNRDRERDKKRDKDKIVNEIEFDNDERFRRVLIRNVEIQRIENVNERIDAIWLRWDVFVVIYKQRVFLFDMYRFEIQKFNRFFVNFRFFDSDELNSNNLSTFRRSNDSLAQNTLSVDDEIFAC